MAGNQSTQQHIDQQRQRPTAATYNKLFWKEGNQCCESVANADAGVWMLKKK
jgi:hypothetical protein